MRHIAAGLGLLAGGLLTVHHVMGGGDMQDKAGRLVEAFIGYNPAHGGHEWDWRKMVFTLPAASGIGVSAVAAKSGANRYTPKGINL